MKKLSSIDECGPDRAFIVEGQNVQFDYTPRSSELLICFDNLSLVDSGFPRAPWLSKYGASLGYSILGVQAYTKDWYRTTNVHEMLEGLRSLGFYEEFDKIVVTGGSMGAFAAPCFAPLIPGAVVLAFSPQSTLNTDLVPQERRFAPARRNLDWVTPPYHDANANLNKIIKALVIYDPYLPEDKAQCSRLIAPNVVHHKIPFFDHATPRLVAKCGVLEQLIKDVTEHGAISPSVFRGLRQKRDMRIWNRRFIEHLDRVGPPSRREKVAALIRAKRPDYYFARPLAPMKNLQISAPVIERKARPLVGFLRFSYLGASDTRLKFNQAGAEQQLFAADRLAARFHFFEKLLLPSLKLQTSDDFKLRIISSDVMPQIYKQRLQDVLADIPNAQVVFSKTRNIGDEIGPILDHESSLSHDGHVISFRVDDDDALSMHFIERLRRDAESLRVKTLITYPNLIGIFLEQDQRLGVSVHESLCHGVGLARINSKQFLNHPFQMVHTRVWRRFPTLMDPTFVSAIRTFHSQNDTAVNRDRNILGLKHLAGDYGTDAHIQRVQTALTENFPNQTLERIEKILQTVPSGSH